MDATLRSYLQTQVREIDRAMHQDLAGIHSSLLRDVVDGAVFNGGKRLRPLLCLLQASACQPSKQVPEKIYQFAACLEYLHAASLLHDDVIDHATQRRGKASSNTRWGNHRVILAGDFLHARALFLAGSLGGIACVEQITKVVQGMVAGEYLQLEHVHTHNPSEDHYFQVLEGKTAMLISAACETGCILADGTPAQREAAARFGKNLGLAFQVADDLLDYLGDVTKMGKETGCDWREQRMTLPLIYALTDAPATAQDWLREHFNLDQAKRVESFDHAKQLLERNHAFERAKSKAQQLIESAIAELDLFQSSDARQFLIALAQYAIHRDQ